MRKKWTVNAFCWCRCTTKVTYSYEGRSKSSQTDTINYEIRTSYFVTFQHRHLQLKCTWSSMSPSLWYRCRRIVVPCLPASHLPCNTNATSEYGGWRSSSNFKAGILDGSQCLSWPVIRCVVMAPSNFCFFLNWKNSWKDKIFWRRGRYLHGIWLAGRPRTTTGSELWRNAGPSAFQLQVSMLKTDKIRWTSLVVNCVGLRTFWTPPPLHFRGNPVKYLSIPAGFPWTPSPRRSLSYSACLGRRCSWLTASVISHVYAQLNDVRNAAVSRGVNSSWFDSCPVTAAVSTGHCSVDSAVTLSLGSRHSSPPRSILSQ